LYFKIKVMNLSEVIHNGKSEIKNIIFDWGGVITDLHLDATKIAFQQLGLTIFDESVPHVPHDKLFIPFETGRISPEEFRNMIRSMSATPLTDAMIDNAWNAMLGELPAKRWHLLQEARKKYRTFLLSNTNAIHLPYYSGRIFKTYGTNGYFHLFEKTYFSHELGMRKPNTDIFEYVFHDAGISPAETLFIDDFIENIETGSKLGMKVFHLKAPYTLADLFENDSR